jgi:hypothetical protein
MWLERPEQWDKLAEHLRAAGEFGLDTETHGQPDKTSPQHRARVHCWSVGLLTDTRSPRGFRRAVGRVLPRVALDRPSLRAVLADPGVRKWAHNAPHDRHALENEGVEVRGLEDSLQWFRVACPGRRDYGLKDIEQWALGYPSRPGFLDMVSYEATVVHARRRRERGCICGATPCRARSTSDFCDADGVWRPHLRVEWSVFTPVPRTEKRRYAVTDFVPGAQLEPLIWKPTKDKPNPPTWWKGQPIDRLSAFWDYSLADATRGIECVDWLRNQKPAQLRYPWFAPSCSAPP